MIIYRITRLQLFFLFMCLACSRTLVAEDANQRKITRRMAGSFPASITDFPFVMAVFHKENYIATFSLITYETALGVAHVLYTKNTNDFIGSVGNDNKFQGTKVKFEKKIIHPHYDDVDMNNDIALLILKNPLTNLPNVSPVALSLPHRKYVLGPATMISWGMITPNETSAHLRQAIVHLNDPRKWKGFRSDQPLTGFEIITVSENAHGLNGDSGCPLIYTSSQDRKIQIGVMSNSYSANGYPDIYMSTSVYYNFIKQKSKGKPTFY